MVGLGDLPGGDFFSAATSSSADGSVVVGAATSSTGSEAFAWDETNGMRAVRQILIDQGIDMTGWDLAQANGISADGLTIVGYGTNPLGFNEAWIATIPEPGTALAVPALGLPEKFVLASCLIGFALFATLRRTRRKIEAMPPAG
jgi:hypothetical protein